MKFADECSFSICLLYVYVALVLTSTQHSVKHRTKCWIQMFAKSWIRMFDKSCGTGFIVKY